MKNRRELLMASAALAAGAGTAGLASCGDDDERTGSTETVSTVEIQTDIATLGTLLDLEDSAVVAYETLGIGGDVPFGAHERAHADRLRRMIGELGGEVPEPKPAAQYRATFPRIRDEHDALLFALDLETTAIGAYADALGKVATGSVQVTLASILATEAEHASVLLGRLNRPRVPDAFVTGSPAPEAG